MGYRLDDTEQWFWFCKAQDSGCTTCQELSNNIAQGSEFLLQDKAPVKTCSPL